MAQANTEITNSIGMKLTRIPKGTFMMGSPRNGLNDPPEKPNRWGPDEWDIERQHEVTLARDYFLGCFQVTQAQYYQIMGNNPSFFKGEKLAERDPQTNQLVKEVDNSNYPVDTISWHDAVEFCRKLSELPEEKAAGRVYRLPTEAEWEYACRAGSQAAYFFGDDPESLGDYAWFVRNSRNSTHPVGQKKPNAWGLYDMTGNVWEWCHDRYDKYPKQAVNDPAGPAEGSAAVIRGGSWHYDSEVCRSGFRSYYPLSCPYISLGFRVAMNSPEIPD